MKTPVLREIHERSGGRFAEYAGWMLPMDYGSAVREVRAVRTAAGLFDVSHMGRFDMYGESSLRGLQNLLTNDLPRLADAGGQYTLICNTEGGVKDDLIIYRRSYDLYYLVVNAANLDKDKGWISQRLPTGAGLVDCTDDTALFALQGPESAAILARAGMPEVAEVRRFHLADGRIAGVHITAARTGYTGEDGFEITCRSRDAELVWTTLLSAGEPEGLVPCGLAARDVLRIEAGLPLYDHEMDEQTTPVEAGLMRWVKLDKGAFIGRDAIAARLRVGPEKKLIGVRMEGRDVPRAGDAVQSSAGEGRVTSGTFSPTLGCGVAMAYMPPEIAEGERVQVIVHGKPRPGWLRKLPLYSRGAKPADQP